MAPLPPPEKSSSPSSLPALGPLWTTNEDGGEAVEKELPPAEGRLARLCRRSEAWLVKCSCGKSLFPSSYRSHLVPFSAPPYFPRRRDEGTVSKS